MYVGHGRGVPAVPKLRLPPSGCSSDEGRTVSTGTEQETPRDNLQRIKSLAVVAFTPDDAAEGNGPTTNRCTSGNTPLAPGNLFIVPGHVPTLRGSSLQELLERLSRCQAFPTAYELLQKYMREGPCSRSLLECMDQMAAAPVIKDLSCEIGRLRRRREAATQLLDAVETEVEAIERQLRQKVAHRRMLVLQSLGLEITDNGGSVGNTSGHSARAATCSFVGCNVGSLGVQDEELCELASAQCDDMPATELRSLVKAQLQESQDLLAERDFQLRAMRTELTQVHSALASASAEVAAAARRAIAAEEAVKVAATTSAVSVTPRKASSSKIPWPAGSPVEAAQPGSVAPSSVLVLGSVQTSPSPCSRGTQQASPEETRTAKSRRRLRLSYASLVRHTARNRLGIVLYAWSQRARTRRHANKITSHASSVLLVRERRGLLALVLRHWRGVALIKRWLLDCFTAPFMLARSCLALVRAVLVEWWWLVRTKRAEEAAELACAEIARIDSEDPELLVLGRELVELRSSGASVQDFMRSIDQHLGRLKSRICGQVDNGFQSRRASKEGRHMTARKGAISDNPTASRRRCCPARARLGGGSALRSTPPELVEEAGVIAQ